MRQNPLGIISEHIIYRTLQRTLFPLTLVQSCQSYHVIFKWPNAQISQTFSSVHLKDYRGDPNYLLLDIFQWLKWSEFLKPTLKSTDYTHSHTQCVYNIHKNLQFWNAKVSIYNILMYGNEHLQKWIKGK